MTVNEGDAREADYERRMARETKLHDRYVGTHPDDGKMDGVRPAMPHKSKQHATWARSQAAKQALVNSPVLTAAERFALVWADSPNVEGRPAGNHGTVGLRGH